MTDWTKPQDVDALTVSFPAKVCGTLLPPMAEIPDEFKRGSNPWCMVVSRLFFEGGKMPATKKDIDARKAKAHLSAVLGSYEPQHEHKDAGAAWLMSMWYETPDVASKGRKK